MKSLKQPYEPPTQSGCQYTTRRLADLWELVDSNAAGEG